MRHRQRASRPAFALVTVLLAGTVLSGCSAAPATELTVLGSWVDEEQADFEAVLRDFEAESGIRARYQGHRDVSQVLQAGIERGRPPDVAVLPRLNDLQRYVNAGELQPLNDIAAADPDAAPQLIRLARKAEPDGNRVDDERVYAVAIATSLKSVFWFNPARSGKLDQTPPRTWADLVGLAQGLGGGGQAPWCLGMSSPPVSGWPGTDWIEDILLHQAGQASYEKWTRGQLPWISPQVRNAWVTWGALLTDQPRRTASLYTTWDEAGRNLFPPVQETDPPTARPCHLDHQGSFAVRNYRAHLAELAERQGDAAPSTPDTSSFAFFSTPPVGSVDTSSLREVSDDVAAMFRASEPARKLMAYLASERAQRVWREVNEEVFFSRRGTPEVYQGTVVRAVAARLSTGILCRDASDLLPAAMATAFERAVLVYLEAPDRLDRLLAELDAVQASVSKAEWMDLGCDPTTRQGT
ncbi:ABC transporter substrate-binding protein [Micromonospora sp. CPCC 205539]|uniref:ABC transporter substrate-binding protein n=1 Tax=Micromonospora sp. CPCC 205539 TaxID=3122408 RepID=UPI002FF32B82